MSDPAQLHAAHVAISAMATKCAEEAIQLDEAGDRKAAREAKAKTKRWLKLAMDLEKLVKED